MADESPLEGDNSSRLHAQAREAFARAERNTKRRWRHGWRKANFIKAATAFNEAAVLYAHASRADEAKKALWLAYECFKRKRDWFRAAKTLEQAIKIAIQEEETAGLAEAALTAASVFEKASQPDSAAHLLERVAKLLEQKEMLADWERLLEKAASIVETENRPMQAAYYTNMVLTMKLQSSDLTEAVAKAKKLVLLYQEAGHKPSTGRCILSLVLLLVALRRFQDAEKVVREFGNYCTVEQNLAIEQLLVGADKDDWQTVNKALESGSMSGIKDEYKMVFDVIAQSMSMSSSDEQNTVENGDVNWKAGIILAEPTENNGGQQQQQQQPANDKWMPDKIAQDLDSSTRKRSKLEKRATVGAIDAARLMTSLDLEENCASHLSPRSIASAYGDVTGFDQLPPNFMGMTADQWREYKLNRCNYQDEALESHTCDAD